MKRALSRAVSIGLFAAALSGCNDGTASTLSALEIVPAPGDLGSVATGINAQGQVSGVRETTAGNLGFVADAIAFTSIPPLAGDSYADAAAVDATGGAAGTSYALSANTVVNMRPYLYQSGASAQVALPADDTQGMGTALSPNGVVAGLSSNPPLNHLFVTTAGVAKVIPFATGDTSGVATAVNAAGIVVGYSYVMSGDKHGFFYEPVAGSRGAITGLDGDTESFPLAINASGLVVGYSTGTSGVFHSFLFDTTTRTTTPVAVLTGAQLSRAAGINSAGQIVGGASTGGGVGAARAFIVKNAQAGGALDLNGFVDKSITAVWTFFDAVAINDQGQIAANAIRADGTVHAFRLSPPALGGNGSIEYGADGGTNLNDGGLGLDDAGFFDGGPVDAGLNEDAGPDDAGTSADAGSSSDAGATSDAGTGSDAGSSDAGGADSGTSDAGSSDAGAGDAGPDGG